MALVDTGATHSVLRRSTFQHICKATGRCPVLKKTVQLCGVTGHNLQVHGSTEIADDELGPIPVIIVEGISHAMILGRDVLVTDGARIDYENSLLTWRGHGLHLKAASSCHSLASLGPRPPSWKAPHLNSASMQTRICLQPRVKGLGVTQTFKFVSKRKVPPSNVAPIDSPSPVVRPWILKLMTYWSKELLYLVRHRGPPLWSLLKKRTPRKVHSFKQSH